LSDNSLSMSKPRYLGYYERRGSLVHPCQARHGHEAGPRPDLQTLNNQLVLSWTNANFTLQSAPALTGRFTNLPAATSPYTNSLTAPQQFFRLIGN